MCAIASTRQVMRNPRPLMRQLMDHAVRGVRGACTGARSGEQLHAGRPDAAVGWGPRGMESTWATRRTCAGVAADRTWLCPADGPKVAEKPPSTKTPMLQGLRDF